MKLKCDCLQLIRFVFIIDFYHTVISLAGPEVIRHFLHAQLKLCLLTVCKLERKFHLPI